MSIKASKPDTAKLSALLKKPSLVKSSGVKSTTAKATEDDATTSTKKTAIKTVKAMLKTPTAKDTGEALQAKVKKAAATPAKVVKTASISKADGKTAAKATAKAPAVKGRAGSFPDNMKIKILVKDNPKRPNTAAFDKFEAYRTNKTVGEWRAAGGDLECLRYDIKKEFIAVS